jgi:hypothetical protein
MNETIQSNIQVDLRNVWTKKTNSNISNIVNYMLLLIRMWAAYLVKLACD